MNNLFIGKKHTGFCAILAKNNNYGIVMKIRTLATLAIISMTSNIFAMADAKVQAVAEEMRDILVDNYTNEKDAFLTYEACYLNPAGSGLSTIQKQVYCLLPLKFRICATPKMIRTGDKESSIRECDKDGTYGTISHFEDVISEVFRSESPDNDSEVKGLFSYPLDPNKSFGRSLGNLLQNTVMSYVAKKEQSLCIMVRGESAVCFN